MARNRQRAKERQARRRQEGDAPASAPQDPLGPSTGPPPREREAPPEEVPAPPFASDDRDALREEADLMAGAPPQDLGAPEGRAVDDDEPVLDDEDDHFDPEEDQPEEPLEPVGGPRGHRGEEPAEDAQRSRLVQFIIAVRAELRRVQWPDRQTLFALTGVVLGFVVLAGGYLGLLDAVFSRVIQAIL